MSETSPAPTSILYIILPFLGIILGWILGLLSPFITRQFKRKQEIGDFKKGIYIELIEIKIYRPMHLTEVHTIYCILVSRYIPHNILYQDRGNFDRLLNKSIKQFTSRFGSSTIKTKGKFIQIIIQMRYLNSSLMSS